MHRCCASVLCIDAQHKNRRVALECKRPLVQLLTCHEAGEVLEVPQLRLVQQVPIAGLRAGWCQRIAIENVGPPGSKAGTAAQHPPPARLRAAARPRRCGRRRRLRHAPHRCGRCRQPAKVAAIVCKSARWHENAWNGKFLGAM